MTARRVFQGVLVLVASAAIGWADDAQTAPPPPGGPGGPGHFHGNFMGPEGHFGEIHQLFDGKVVTGAPFSAQVTTETVQTLGDGNKITRKITSTRYRDSQGRTRRDETFGAVGPLVAGHSGTKVFIGDPVAGTDFILSPTKKEAVRFARPNHTPRTGGAAVPRGPRNGATSNAEGESQRLVPERQTETLGKQTIGGVDAEGTRTTTTIPVGMIGNESPIVITRERWYSPALQTVILAKISDPRFGETTTTWTGIKTAEPDATLFTVPGDYAVKDGPHFNKKLNSPTPPAN